MFNKQLINEQIGTFFVQGIQAVGSKVFGDVSPHTKIIKIGKKLNFMTNKKYPVLVESGLHKVKIKKNGG